MRSIRLLLVLVAVALVPALSLGCGPAVAGQAPKDKAAVPPETAVYYAVEYARASRPGPAPQLMGEPTDIRGKVMTQEESERFRPAGQRYWASQEERDLPVWMVAIRGDFQVQGGSNATYRQGIFVLDAHTVQAMGSSIYPTGHEVDASSLPRLSLPTGPVPTPFATYTLGPAPTPAPTATAAPPAPSPTPLASQASTTVTCQGTPARTPVASNSERSSVSGRVVSVALDQIVVRTADQGCAVLPLSLYEIWDNLWVKDIPLEVGDDVFASDAAFGGPKLYVNIVNLIGTISNARREGDLLLFEMEYEVRYTDQRGADTIKVERRASISGSGPRDGQRGQVIGRRLKDGSVLGVTVFFY